MSQSLHRGASAGREQGESPLHHRSGPAPRPATGRLDLSVYVVLDLGRAGEHPEELVGAALRGGATVIQLRDKRESGAALLELASHVRPWLEDAGVPLVVNDRLDWALAAGAGGLHLGQHDLDPALARARAEAAGRPDLQVGVSVTTVEQARAAADAGAAYLSVSPVWTTPTKVDTEPAAGPLGVARIRAAVPGLPLVAIGGITPARAGEVIAAGADGVAVVSALSAALHPESAARALADAVQAALRARAGEEHP